MKHPAAGPLTHRAAKLWISTLSLTFPLFERKEKFLYDLLQKKEKTRHGALEAIEEHHVIEMLLNELSDFPRNHDRWVIKLEVLEEYTRHYLEEEESDVFPEVSGVLDEKRRNELGTEFNKVKEKQLSVL